MLLLLLLITYVAAAGVVVPTAYYQYYTAAAAVYVRTGTYFVPTYYDYATTTMQILVCTSHSRKEGAIQISSRSIARVCVRL